MIIWFENIFYTNSEQHKARNQKIKWVRKESYELHLVKQQNSPGL